MIHFYTFQLPVTLAIRLIGCRMDFGDWSENSRGTYNKWDGIARSTAQVYCLSQNTRGTSQTLTFLKTETKDRMTLFGEKDVIFIFLWVRNEFKKFICRPKLELKLVIFMLILIAAKLSSFPELSLPKQKILCSISHDQFYDKYNNLMFLVVFVSTHLKSQNFVLQKETLCLHHDSYKF